MLNQILNLLWNSRWQNLWIMLELVIIAIVSWIVLDPLFVLNYNQTISSGYEADGLYRLVLTRNKADTISVPAEDYIRIMTGLRSHRDIESATCVLRGAYPSSPGNNQWDMFKDSVTVKMTYIPFFTNSGLFQTWRQGSLPPDSACRPRTI